MERTYTSVPSHNFITFTLTLYAGGSWTGSAATFHFDSLTIASPQFQWSSEGYPSFGPLQYKGAINHVGTAGSSLSFRILVNLYASGMQSLWFGFRGLSLYFHKDYTGTDINTTTMCQTSSAKSPVTDQCPCNMTQGPNSTTGVCESCPPGCDFLSGPAPYQCLTCNSATIQGWNGTRCVLNCGPSSCTSDSSFVA